MFTCEQCLEAIGPRVSPVALITNVRPAEYHNEYYVEDEWGNKELKKVDSAGSEIVTTVHVCGECGEKEYGVPAGKPLAATKPTYAFQEVLAPPIKSKVVAVVVHTALERTNHESKRAEADCKVAIPAIKQFVDNNKSFMI